jgi:hypothetical protein
MISERTFARSFDSVWQEVLPLLTPHFVAIFNQAYEVALTNESGNELSVLPVDDGIEHPDIVSEFAFQLAKIACTKGLPLGLVAMDASLTETAEKNAVRLIERYEGSQPHKMAPMSEVERLEGFRLCERYSALYSVFPGSPVEFNPRFQGAGFINASEGDISIGNCLVEVKTSTRKCRGRDIRQLIIYLALDANASGNRWSCVGVFNPRRGTFHRAEIDPLILRLSGGKPPSDVFAELVAFAESYEPAIERTF